MHNPTLNMGNKPSFMKDDKQTEVIKALNSTSKYLDDLFNDFYFDGRSNKLTDDIFC